MESGNYSKIAEAVNSCLINSKRGIFREPCPYEHNFSHFLLMVRVQGGLLHFLVKVAEVWSKPLYC